MKSTHMSKLWAEKEKQELVLDYFNLNYIFYFLGNPNVALAFPG